MITDANIYSQLLLYSFLSGIFLKISYDILSIIKILSINISTIFSHKISEFAFYNPYKPKDLPSPPILLKRNSTVSSLLSQMMPKEKHGAFTAAIDLIFALISAIVTVLLFFGLNLGELRWFVFPIMSGGYILYAVTLSRPIKRLILAVTLKVVSLIVPVKRLAEAIVFSPIRKTVTALKQRTKRSKPPQKAFSRKGKHPKTPPPLP